MGLYKGKKSVAIILCLVILLTLFNTQTASAAPCYAHDRNKTERVEPTCGKNGYIKYSCSKCGKQVDYTTLLATGNHSWGDWKTDKSPTCTVGGSKHRVCKVCDKMETEALPAKGHSYGSWYRGVDPDCVNDGKDYRKCSTCGNRESRKVNKLGHNMQGRIKSESPTCVKDGFTVPICSRCSGEVGSRTVIPATGHSWGVWVRDTEPTCETNGTRHRICSKCGERENGTIDKLGHLNDGQVKRVNKTCTTDGYTITVCSRCGKENGSRTIIKAGHVWGDWITDTNAGCETTGTKHRICSACGTRENGTIDALGHLMNGQIKRVNKTCTKDGYTVAVCSRCGKEGTRNVIKASHNWNDWVTDIEAKCEVDGTKHRTCKDCGKREDGTITKLGHDKGEIKTVDASCVKDGYKVKVCSRCKKELGEHTTIKALGHLYEGKVKRVAATCVSDGYSVVVCSRCGKEQGTRTVIKATGNHTWGDWVTDTDATCETEGTKHRNCTVCGKKETGTIPKYGHLVEGKTKTVKPTCTQDGYRVVLCSRCGQEVGARTKIAAKHDWSDWTVTTKATCDKEGTKTRTCNACGKKQTETIEKLKHVYNGVRKTVDATCTKDGYTAMICSRCGAEQKENRTVIEAKGHTWGDWITDKKATCEADGSKHHVCLVCGEKETKTIKKLGHLVDGQIRKVDATCTKDGYSVVVCSRCGKDQGDKNIIAAHHVWGSWIVDENASCAKAGSKHRVCSKCKKTETEVIPISDKHSINGTIKTVEATCGKDGYKVMVCSVCGKEQGDRTILHKTGKHTWQKWVTDTDATCEGTGTKHRICDVCGEREDGKIKELGHLVEGQTKKIYPAKGEPARVVVVCSRCGKEMVDPSLEPTQTPDVDDDVNGINSDGKKPDSKPEAQDSNGQGSKDQDSKPGSQDSKNPDSKPGEQDSKNQDSKPGEQASDNKKSDVPESKPGSENNVPELTASKSPWSWLPFMSSTSLTVSVTYEGGTQNIYLNDLQGTARVRIAGGGAIPSWVSIDVKDSKVSITIKVNNGDFRDVTIEIYDSETNKSVTVSIRQGVNPKDEKWLLPKVSPEPEEPEPSVSPKEETPKEDTPTPEPSPSPSEGGSDFSEEPKPPKKLNPTVKPTDTPKPKPADTPEPKPSDTPEPKPSDTPEPKPVDTPEPKPADTPGPTDNSGVTEEPKPTKSIPEKVPSKETEDPGTVTPVNTPSPKPTPIGLEVNPSLIELESYKQEMIQVEVSGYNLPYNVEPDLIRGIDWISVKETSVQSTYELVIKENPGDDIREGTVVFEDKKTGERAYLKVVQSGRRVEVVFDENRGLDSQTGLISYPVGDKYDLPDGPDGLEEGDFLGWFTERKGGRQITEDDTVSGLITTLYAHYKSSLVRVEFVIDNTHGEIVPSHEVHYVYYGEPFGKTFVQVGSARKYRILVWKDSSGKYYDENTIVSTKDPIILYPVWGGVDEYMVIFEGNGNLQGQMKSEVYKYDVDYDWPAVKYDNGVGFIGWNKTPKSYRGVPDYDLTDVAGKFRNIADRDQGHVILYAIWREMNYVVYYDPFRGEEMRIDVLYHIFSPKGIEEFPQLELEGFHFVGWREKEYYLECIEQDVHFSSDTIYAVDGFGMTLFPVYEIEEGKRFIILYDPKSDPDIEVRGYPESQEAFTLPIRSSKDGLYSFVGWNHSNLRDHGVRHRISADEYNTPIARVFNSGYRCSLMVANWKLEPQQLVLHYNYEDRVENVKIKDEKYTLPTPERRGYVFGGWEDAEHKDVFEGGTPYSVFGRYSELYAIWQPVTISIEYYDSLTGNMLYHVNATADQTITSNHVSVKELEFYGWTDKMPEKMNPEDTSWLFERLNRDYIYQPGDSVLKLNFEEGTVKLYSCYLLKDIKQNHTTIIYLPNKGYSTPPRSEFGVGETVTVADYNMTRYQCEFAGWKLLNWQGIKTYPYFSGDTINRPVVFGQTEVLFLEAQWTSKHTITIDPNWAGQKQYELTGQYLRGDIIKTAELPINERKGYVIRGWRDNDGKEYPFDSYVSVPDRDLKLTAIWEPKTFRINYHNGFDPSEFVSIHGDSCTRYSFDSNKFPWMEVPGYKFLGWTTVNNADLNMPPININKKDIITPNRTELIYLNADLDLYSCYEELGVPQGKVMVVYNPMGGIGGPGVEYFDIGKEYRISEKEPTRDGYEFQGWSYFQFDNRVNCVAKDEIDYEETDNKVYLFAVWSLLSSNSRKKELQALYGKDAMPDFMFENEYESPEWEKVNDYCYFVIKTRNAGTAPNERHMHSDYMILEYRCGTWYLSGEVGSASVKKQVEYDILTHHNNLQGRLGKIAVDAAFTMAEQIPIARRMLKAEELEALFIDLASTWGTSASNDAMIKFASLIASTLYKQLKNGHEDEHFVADVMDAIWPKILECATHGITLNQETIVAAIGTLGKAVIKNGNNLNPEKIAQTFGNINDSINLDAEKWWEAIVNRGSKEFDKLDDLGNLSKVFKSGAFDVGAFVWGTIWDQIKISVKNKNLDPFGDYDLALQTFQTEVKSKFGARIANQLPDVINKVYRAYYGLD